MTLRHHSIEPAHPGALMADVIDNLEISKAGMARRLGIARGALYNVLDKRSAVTADMALRFEHATGTSADLMVRMQAAHDLWKARQTFMPAAAAS